ncbi:MAG: hypothetical protein QXS85_05410 [Acidilobaceae archaeon]
MVECRDYYLCPRCRSEMEVYVERGSGPEKREVARYLKCPACSFRIHIETVAVRESEDSLSVTFIRRRQARQPLKTRLCYTA